MYTFMKCLSWIICHIPEGCRRALGTFLGAFFWTFVPKKRKVLAQQQILDCGLTDDPEKAMAIARASTVRFGPMIIEVLSYPRYTKEMLDEKITWHGKEYLDELKASGEGAVFMASHAGNWDNQAEVDKALAAITECVKTGKGNLLELAVEAARVRATLGEISYACEQIVGRYKAIIRTISGVYSSESKNDSDFKRACELAEKFAKKEGRQPRIMVAKMGQDGHDRGAKVVATGYADCGFDVDMGPLFQTPAEAAREAVENDVHVVGVSSLAAGHKTLVPQIIEELKKLGREDIVVIAGGVIPAQDYDFLYKAGVAAIFGPGTPVAKAACQILEILMDEE